MQMRSLQYCYNYIIFIIERTQKVKMGSIKAVVSEPIEGHEDYHVMVSTKLMFEQVATEFTLLTF